MKNFYCQKKCGDVNFSIEEWNQAQKEIKELKAQRPDFMMDPVTICQSQCEACIKVVKATRAKNKRIRVKQQQNVRK